VVLNPSSEGHIRLPDTLCVALSSHLITRQIFCATHFVLLKKKCKFNCVNKLVVSILPPRCWRQHIGWSYCATSWTFGLMAWRNTKKKLGELIGTQRLTQKKMTHIHTNKTGQTENVSNGEVILKGCISGQKQTCLSKQTQWRTFRQFRVSEENYFDQFSWIQCSKLRVGKYIFLGENLRDICKQHSAWRTCGMTLKKHVNFSLISTTLTDLIVAAIYDQFTMS